MTAGIVSPCCAFKIYHEVGQTTNSSNDPKDSKPRPLVSWWLLWSNSQSYLPEKSPAVKIKAFHKQLLLFNSAVQKKQSKQAYDLLTETGFLHVLHFPSVLQPIIMVY